MAVTAAMRTRVSILGTCFQQNASLLRAIWWWRCETASHRGQAPFLDVGFDEDEASLAKVDVDYGGTVGTDGGEEVLRLEPMHNLIELLAVPGEEDGACPRSITNADNIALHKLGPVGSCVEGLVVSTAATRLIGNRVFVVA